MSRLRQLLKRQAGPAAPKADARIVYGVMCTWWDSASEAASRATGLGHTLPCCPRCGGLLMEVPSIEPWWKSVDHFESEAHPGYRAMVEWMRGKCFPSMQAAAAAYAVREQEADA